MDKNNLPFEQDAALSSIARKVTSPASSQTTGQRHTGGSTPTRTEMSGAINARIRTLRNAERIYDALPEMETIVTIAVSQLLSTKDLVTNTLNYDVLDPDLPVALRDRVSRRLREKFNDERGLPKKLYNWIYKAYRSKGATPIMVLSDAGFDDLFGLAETEVAQEAMKKGERHFNRQLGILRTLRSDADRPLTAAESIFTRTAVPNGPQQIKIDLSGLTGMFGEPADGKVVDDVFTISLTDNPNIMQLSEAYKRVARESSRRARGIQYGVPYEEPTPVLQTNNLEQGKVTAGNAFADLTDINPRANEPEEIRPYLEIKKNSPDQKNYLEATDREIPAECLFPVALPGEEREPLGWLAFIDDMGNYITGNSPMYQDTQVVNYLNGEGLTDSNINRASLGLNTDMALRPDLAQRFYTRFGELTMGKLTESLTEALGGAEISLALGDSIQKVLAIRHLAKRHTQALYIPADNLCYFATDFNEDGLGVSIAERSFIISTVRMALLFATMNGSILNSARHMQYDIELSPDARNGQETVDRIKSDIINGQNKMLPQWGSALDVWSMSTNAGMAFNVIGNEYYSSHKVSVSDTTPDYKIPDTAIDEDLLRKTCRIANVDPDLVMTPENIEFASQIFSKSLLVTQQTIKKQEILEPVLTKYVRNHAMASPSVQKVILEEILEWLRDNNGAEYDVEKSKDEVNSLYRSIINSISCSIPPPDTSTASSQMDQYDKRVEFIDKIIDDNWDKGMGQALSNLDIGFDSDTTKSILRQFYVNSWMERNGIETDLLDILTNPDKRLESVIEISDRFQDTVRMIAMLSKRAKSKFDSTMRSLGSEAPDDADPFATPSDDGMGGGADDDLDDGMGEGEGEGDGLDDMDNDLDEGDETSEESSEESSEENDGNVEGESQDNPDDIPL